MRQRQNMGRWLIVACALTGGLAHFVLWILFWVPPISGYVGAVLFTIDSFVVKMPAPNARTFAFDSAAATLWKLLVYGTGFWTLIGAGIGVAWHASRRRGHPQQPMPACCICGFVWPSPDAARCPSCGKLTFDPAALSTSIPRCTACGFRLTGALSGRCPECGAPFDG